MLFQDIAFWVLSVTAILAALGVVLVRDLFRAALLLAGVFVAVAGLFVLMSAEFLAVVQVLIYVGAISILIIFAVMLTRDVQRGNLANRLQVPAVLFPALLLAALVVVVVATDWRMIPENEQQRVALVQTQSASVLDEGALAQVGFTDAAAKQSAREAGLADLLIGRFVLPFEAVSVLLLAAVIGSLALARPNRGEG
jgi:NADH:ubiquinone oxidoreductase subunit 6 (subunit J)